MYIYIVMGKSERGCPVTMAAHTPCSCETSTKGTVVSASCPEGTLAAAPLPYHPHRVSAA